MKNFKIKNLRFSPSLQQPLQDSLLTYDTSNQKLFTLSQNKLKIIQYSSDLKEMESEQEIDISSLKLNNFIYMCHQSFYDRLIIFTSDGHLVTVNTENGNFQSKQIHSTESKFIEIILSPSQELIALMTSNGEILILNKMLEIENQQNLIEEKIDYLEANISWRFDSEYFNLTYKTSQGNKFITFTKHLQPFVSPSKQHHEYPLMINYSENYHPEIQTITSWSLNGSQIASLKNKEGKKFVILLEKNVLFYEEFEISEEFQTWNVQNLFWYPTESIIFIKIHLKNKNHYLIYQKSNGRWSLKQILKFSVETKAEFFDKNQLLIFTNEGEILFFEFIYSQDIFPYFENDLQRTGLGVFIEGNILKVTPYDRYMIPSPMALIEYEHQKSLMEIFFFKNYLYFIDSDQQLHRLKYTYPNILDQKEFIADLSNFNFIRNLTVYENSDSLRIIFMTNNKEENKLEMRYFNYEGEKVDDINQLEFADDQELNHLLTVNEKLYLIINRKQLYQFNEEMMDLEFKEEIQLTENEFIKQWMVIEGQKDENEDNEVPTLIYINQNDNLFVNNIKIAEDVTSFIMYEEYFLFTTHTNIPYDHLYLFKFDSILQNRFERPDPNSSSDNKNFRKRNIEKNSILISCSETTIQFYLPRGNFETIHHRILLINQVYKFVKQQNYKDGFLLIRKHKLNSNLLIDIDISQFLFSLENQSFLQQMGHKLIDQFILDLTDDFSEELKYIINEDELQKLKQEVINKIGTEQKVNFILQKIENEMDKNSDKYIMNLMVVYSKTNPPALQKGLQIIKKIKDLNSSLNQFRALPPHQSDQKKSEKTYKDILQYFSWLADAEQLYQLSLSLYDLELALMVAEFTQKDPKEYLIFINELKEIKDEIEFKVKINLFLKNFSKAAELLSTGNENQIQRSIEIINEKHIYLDGIKIFKDKPQLNEVQKQFGDYLMNKKDYKNAAIILQNFQDKVKDVCYCYEKILDFQGFHSYTQQFHVDDEMKDKVINLIKKSYEKTKSFNLMAKMYVQLNDQEKSCIYYLKDFNYKKVRNFILKQSHFVQNSEIQKHLMLAYYEELNDIIKKNQNYHFWKNRLEFVQDRKNSLMQQGLEDENLSVLTDLTSMKGTETDSNVSVITGLRTGVRKNKKPRNLYQRRYKENSVYEEEWLVESLNIVINISEEKEKNLSYFFSLLIIFQKIEELKEIYSEFKKFAQIITSKPYFKTLGQKEFEQKHGEVFDLYNHVADFDQKVINGQKQRKFDLLKKYEEIVGQLIIQMIGKDFQIKTQRIPVKHFQFQIQLQRLHQQSAILNKTI